jgi:HEPN/RES N-terminal domain 1/RES domain
MGVSDWMLEVWERGWCGSEKFVCPDCIDDEYLRNIVATAASEGQECSFCDAAPAAEFDVFMEALMVGIDNTFEQADDAGMPWEHGYVFKTYDHWEVADEFAWVAAPEHSDKVLDEIRDCLEEKTYASRWWNQLEPDEAYSGAWNDFRYQILHRTRFVFWATRDDDDRYREIPVANVLQQIGTLLSIFECFTVLPAGTAIYRARGHANLEDSDAWVAADLGTNTPDKATGSSRMSPSGIPLFYGADEADTALAEVARADKSPYFTAAMFRTTAPIAVLDLTAIPVVPSIFDPERGGRWGEIGFLNDLVAELRKPVDLARSSLDYVPTQVFCEYFLRVFPDIEIRGLAWNSAATADGRRCLALDIPHEDCIDLGCDIVDRPQLELVEGTKSVHRRPSGS